MEEMQQHNMSWIEVQFLKKAVDILCECRRTLMFTYVFAYYLKKNNPSEIFEVRMILIQNEILHNFDFPNMRAQLLYLVKNVKHRLLSRRKANINLTHRAICADYFIDFLIA